MDIEEDLSKDSVAGVLKNNNHALKSFELCREAAVDLETASEGLMAEMRSAKGFKRSYASLRVVIKKGNFERYRTRLTSATRLLSLSQHPNNAIQGLREWLRLLNWAEISRALIQVQPEMFAEKLLNERHDIDLQTPQNKDGVASDPLNDFKVSNGNTDSMIIRKL
jgi:hypothetical protein